MAQTKYQTIPATNASGGRLLSLLNQSWHKQALLIYMVIVVAHWLEHLVQAYQIWLLGWPRHHALGVLGLAFPWLVHSEWLHYGYALAMLVGLAVLRPAFVGRARTWWTIALVIQVWHHLEHALLLLQALTGVHLMGAPVPTSILQLVFPRVELHLFYNAVVFLPMVIAMVYHLYPSAQERRQMRCNCVRLHPQYQ